MKRRLPAEEFFGTDRYRFLNGLLISAALIAAVWMFRGAFRCYFIQDDYAWLLLSRFESFGEWIRCLFRFNPAGTYRPLSQETFFWAAQKIFGMWPAGFHMIVMAAHLAGVLLLYRLLRRFASGPAAVAGAFLYAVHSAHVVSLFWISAFPELLAMVFLLSSVLLFIRFDRLDRKSAYVLSLICMVLGFMSKESILTLPLILAAYCILWARSRLRYTLPYFAASGLYVLLRIAGGVHWAPYALGFGRQTLQDLAAYASWMAGFSNVLVQSKFGWKLPESYFPIASAFLILIVFLFLVSRIKRAALFGLLWMIFALQPVLYFTNHGNAYYLAPALAGFAILLSSALSTLPYPTGLKRNVIAAVAACMFFVLFYPTAKAEGGWWIERTAARKVFIDQLLAVDRRVPSGGKAYIASFGPNEFEKLENGGVFKVFHLSRHKFHIVMPELDPGLPDAIDGLARSGKIAQAYCYFYSAHGLVDRTAEFRKNPKMLIPEHTARFEQVPGVSMEATPQVLIRGKDTLTLRFVNLNASAVDLLYSIDGQIMPPLLQWRLDADHKASIFADMTTPEGTYDFLAVRESSVQSAPWIRVTAQVRVR